MTLPLLAIVNTTIILAKYPIIPNNSISIELQQLCRNAGYYNYYNQDRSIANVLTQLNETLRYNVMHNAVRKITVNRESLTNLVSLLN